MNCYLKTIHNSFISIYIKAFVLKFIVQNSFFDSPSLKSENF